jgi:intracellular multiplication protein IcmL
MSNTRQNNETRHNAFYYKYYDLTIFVLIGAIFLMLILVAVLLYQVHHRPLPQFFAISHKGQKMELMAYDEPNLLTDTLIKWASKAAVAAYTFDFVNYDKQAALARPYFTDAGWADYLGSIKGLIQTIRQNQLLVNGVVTGAPVISNQGDLTGRGYGWRVQMPFLVTYQSAESITKKQFNVMVTIVKMPTLKNPAAIGIDQFVMV